MSRMKNHIQDDMDSMDFDDFDYDHAELIQQTIDKFDSEFDSLEDELDAPQSKGPSMSL